VPQLDATTATLPPPSTPGAIIEARGVSKVFGEQHALDGIDLTVMPGVIVGLIGPSGCGKTTLVRTLTGIMAPTSGEVRVFGQDPAHFGVRDRTRFGYMPQLPVLFPNLTLWGNLTFMSSIYGMTVRHRRQRLMDLLELVDLVDHRNKQLADCSGGMQRRLSLAATLVHNPELLYLDEPTAGVDPILRERFWGHFRDLRDQGRTIVVPTQYVGEAVSCDLVAVMAHGRIITVQPPSELTRFAFQGDPVEVIFEGAFVPRAEIDALRALPFVRGVTRSDDGLVVVLDQFDTCTRPLDDHLRSRGLTAASILPHAPTFDEIFVQIIEANDREAAVS
jgi:ABC-2 type transport system ATP-binding protein